MGNSKAKNILTGILIAAISTFLTCLGIEIASRVYLWHFASEEEFRWYASVRQMEKRYGDDWYLQGIYAPHRYLGYYPAPNYQDSHGNRHNSLGYRGDEIEVPKPPGVYRIVCLGGSTTYSSGVSDYTQSYPYLLQTYLREQGYDQVEVVNAGVSSYSSFESLINLEFRVLDLDPDMIIIYHGINDVHPRLVWPPSAYRGDNSGAAAPNVVGITMPSIWEYSTALRILALNAHLIDPYISVSRVFITRPSTYYADLFREQHSNGTYPSGIFEEVSAQEMLEANPPVYFERNLRNMVAIAQASGIEAVLLSFSYSSLFDDYPVSTPEYRSALAEGNEVIRRVAEETGALFYDLYSNMPDGREYYVDGRHFTALGNRVRSELIGEFLIESGALDEVETR